MPPLYRIAEVALYSLLNFLPYLIIALYPFRRHLRFPVYLTSFLVITVTLLQICLGIWAGLIPHKSSAFISAASTLIYLTFYFLAVKAPLGQTVYTLLLLSNIGNLVVVLSKCIEGQFFPDYALQAYRWTFSVVMIFVEMLVLIPLFLYIRKTYADIFEKRTAKPIWKFLWLIPATFYIIWYYHLYGSPLGSLELALQPSNSVFLVLINLGALLIHHVVLQHIKIIDANVELSDHNHSLAMQNLQYTKLQERIEETRQAKHDIRHHISIMESYLQNQNYRELETYLASYHKSLPDDSSLVFCENHAVNVILLYFAQQAKENNIAFTAQTYVPAKLEIQEIDLSVLLGNLLENALDACMTSHNTDQKIIIKAKTLSSSIFFTIDNTFDGYIRQNKDGKYLSTKKNGSGLGLTSVKNIVERYNGNMLVSHDSDMFQVSIMLTLPSSCP